MAECSPRTAGVNYSEPLGGAPLAAAQPDLRRPRLQGLQRMSPRRTANGDFFAENATEPLHDSVFGVLRDPMHGAYALGLVAAALISG
jgi:hypothetical protein